MFDNYGIHRTPIGWYGNMYASGKLEAPHT
jgi:hypothetical protein